MANALIVGAGGGIGRALYRHYRASYNMFAVSSEPAATPCWFKSDYTEESLQDIANRIDQPLNLLIICNGMLHGEGMAPEKRLSRLDPDVMRRSLEANFIVPALALKQFSPLLAKDEQSVAALLSARVGSIDDNRTGGWYSYRSAKAALNMLVKSASIELARTHPQLALVAIHPGTTETHLASPFLRPGRHHWCSTDETAANIAAVLARCTPDQTGAFLDWRGAPIAW